MFISYIAAKIGLVDDKNAIIGQGRWRGIDDVHDEVGVGSPNPRTPNALGLDDIVCIPQASGIHQHCGNTAQVDRNLDGITRGTRNWRHDRRIPHRQRVDNTRLPDIRWPGDGDRQAVADTCGARRIGNQRLDFYDQSLQLKPRRFVQPLGNVRFVFGEIQPGFGFGEDAKTALPPGLGGATQHPAGERQGLLALGRSLGGDQVGKPFDLGEIEPTVGERPPAELAGFGEPHPGLRQHRRQYAADDRTAAVKMKLREVLAGRRRGPWKDHDHGVVQRRAIGGIAQPAQRQSARCRQRTAH